MTRTCRVTLIALGLALASSACGDDSPPEASVRAGAAQDDAPAPTQADPEPRNEDALEPFRSAFASNPSFAVEEFALGDAGFFADSADFRALGQLTEVREGPVLDYGTDMYVCGDEEDQPIVEGAEAECAVEVRARSVTFEFVAEEVLGAGEGVVAGQTFTVDMAISTTLDGELSEAGRQFLDRIQEAAPLGETFVLYGTNPEVESNQFVSPGSWALVREDGTLVSMGPGSDPTLGIAGVTRLEELPPVE